MILFLYKYLMHADQKSGDWYKPQNKKQMQKLQSTGFDVQWHFSHTGNSPKHISGKIVEINFYKDVW